MGPGAVKPGTAIIPEPSMRALLVVGICGPFVFCAPYASGRNRGQAGQWQGTSVLITDKGEFCNCWPGRDD